MLKIRVLRDYALSLGWEHWTNAVGLRADEARCVAKIKNQRERWETTAPLHGAGATKEDVAHSGAAALRPQPAQHRRQDPGRQLRPVLPEIGRYDFGHRPVRPVAGRLVDQDGGGVATGLTAGWFFRKDRPSYRRMRDAVLAQKDMDFGERDGLAECFCHD